MSVRTGVRRGSITLAAAAAVLSTAAAPAEAAPPPPPPGCTFDQATGQTTCVTSTSSQTDTYIGDMSGPGPGPGGLCAPDTKSYAVTGLVEHSKSGTEVITVYQGKSAGSGKKVSTTARGYVYTYYTYDAVSCSRP